MQVKNRINEYRCMISYKRLVNSQQVIQECCDNSLQYGSSQVGVVIDAKDSRVIIYDNGDGMDLDTFLGPYHEIHAQPDVDNYISAFGVGSKIFPKLSNARITLTRDKMTGDIYYSIWDVSSQANFENIICDILDVNEIPHVLQFHKDTVKQFLGDKNLGTATILPEITKWGKYSSAKTFRNAIEKALKERYQYFLEKNKNIAALSFSYIPENYGEEGIKIQWQKIEPYDVLASSSHASVFDSSGKIEVRTWCTDDPRRTRQEISVFRNAVKFDKGIQFMTVGKRKDFVPVQSPQFKSIRQAIIFQSESDNSFDNMDTFKTEIELSCELEELCAKEYHKLESSLQAQKQQTIVNKVTVPAKNQRRTFSIGTISRPVAFQQMNGTITMNDASRTYKLIQKAPVELTDIVKLLLDAVDLRKVNNLGQKIEANIKNNGGN